MISTKELERYIGDFLKGFKELELNERLEISKDPKTYIKVSERPSNFGTKALTYSTIVERQGIPVEVKINEALNYSTIILKCEKDLPNYETFSQDEFGNHIQTRKLISTNKTEIRSELKDLMKKI